MAVSALGLEVDCDDADSDSDSDSSGRKKVLRKLLRIPYRRLKAGFSVC